MKFVILLCMFCVVYPTVSEDETNINPLYTKHWGFFKTKYRKTYRPLTEVRKRRAWEENMKIIHLHNLEFDMGQKSYMLASNAFSDLTNKEFAALVSRSGKITKKQPGSFFMAARSAEMNIPPSFDWREEECVTPVKDQVTCGSCYAFAAVGAIETQFCRKTKKLVSMSEQQIVDCSTPFGNAGCNGGKINIAFNYSQTNGLETSSDYPYNGQENSCAYDKSKAIYFTKGWVDLPSNNENKLASAVANTGPIACSMDGTRVTFQFYKGGIYDDPNCSQAVNHAILVVGYGTEEGKDFWIVKNSFGPNWGENGYVRVSRNTNNQCGISSACSYPLLNT